MALSCCVRHKADIPFDYCFGKFGNERVLWDLTRSYSECDSTEASPLLIVCGIPVQLFSLTTCMIIGGMTVQSSVP